MCLFVSKRRILQKVENQIEKQEGGGSSGGASSSQNQINSGSGFQGQHTTSLDEKKQRIHHNIALTEFYKNKYYGSGTDAFGLLVKLRDLYDCTKSGDTVISPPPPLRSYACKLPLVFTCNLTELNHFV